MPARLERGVVEDRQLGERRLGEPGDDPLDDRARLVAEVAAGLADERDLDHAASLGRRAAARGNAEAGTPLGIPALAQPTTCGCDAGGASCEAACGASSSPCACGASSPQNP